MPSLIRAGSPWRSRGRLLLGILASICGAGCGNRSAIAVEPPLQAGAFTAYVAQQFHKALPQAKIQITGPLTLEVEAASGASTAHLDTTFSACLRNPNACNLLVTTHVAQMSAVYGTADHGFAAADLRVVVRPGGYMDQYRQVIAGKGAPVAAPLAGGFWMIGAADRPTAIEMINSSALTSLGLSPEEALMVGKRNMLHSMSDHLTHALEHHRTGVGMLENDPYISSLFAFPELWASLAKVAGGSLLVSVPASNVVLFCNGDEAGANEAMKQAVQEVMSHAERPFSPTVFRWSADGWTAQP
jgi:hypothetical protein